MPIKRKKKPEPLPERAPVVTLNWDQQQVDLITAVSRLIGITEEEFCKMASYKEALTLAGSYQRALRNNEQ